MSDVGTNSVSLSYIKFNIVFAARIISCQYTWQKYSVYVHNMAVFQVGIDSCVFIYFSKIFQRYRKDYFEVFLLTYVLYKLPGVRHTEHFFNINVNNCF